MARRTRTRNVPVDAVSYKVLPLANRDC